MRHELGGWKNTKFGVKKTGEGESKNERVWGGKGLEVSWAGGMEKGKQQPGVVR